jgi:hypothetical protein
VSPHTPMRPSWRCAGCGGEWPCPSARRRLLAEYEGATVSLALYLASNFVDAAADLPDLPAGNLYRRFLGWVRANRLAEPTDDPVPPRPAIKEPGWIASDPGQDPTRWSDTR